ncbi:hypothetical protein VTH06DRAFT_4623 [Thermothelomyces fergusii]
MSYHYPNNEAKTPATSSYDDYSNEKVDYRWQEETRTVKEVARQVSRILFPAERDDNALQTRISDTAGNRPWNHKMATDMVDEEFAFLRQHPECLRSFKGAWVLELLGFGKVPGK